MPPPPGLTALERAARSKSCFERHIDKLRFERVVKVLKDKKEELYDAEENFISRGHLEPLVIHTPVKQTLKAICNGEVGGDGKQDAVALDPLDSDAEKDDDELFNRNGGHYVSLGVKTLQRAFKRCKPSIFTPNNLKELVTRGKREENLNTM